jgi:hypothetical protein
MSVPWVSVLVKNVHCRRCCRRRADMLMSDTLY